MVSLGWLESTARAAGGERFAVRFAVPEGRVTWNDVVHGPTTFENDLLEDFAAVGPAIDGQAERRFRHELVTRHNFERGRRRIVVAFVVAADDRDLFAAFDAEGEAAPEASRCRGKGKTAFADGRDQPA